MISTAPTAAAPTTVRAARLAAILDALSDRGERSVAALAQDLGVSASTLRRDLALLEAQDLLTRIHGGALDARQSRHELPVRYRDGQADDEKAAIAQAVAAMVPPGSHVVGLTGGTTTTAVARALASRDDLTVVTNAVNIASELTVRARARVFMAGGFVRPQSYEVVGPSAIQALSRVTLGYAFIGVDGLSAVAGLTTHDEIEAQTNLAMLRRAHRVVVVADGRKVGRQLMAQIAPTSAAHELITTHSADPDHLEQLRSAGVMVTVVPHPR
ncbi:MAG: DeoR/GlpR family DNA-binding transcription regulator [Nocardioides sp.]